MNRLHLALNGLIAFTLISGCITTETPNSSPYLKPITGKIAVLGIPDTVKVENTTISVITGENEYVDTLSDDGEFLLEDIYNGENQIIFLIYVNGIYINSVIEHDYEEYFEYEVMYIIPKPEY